MIFYNHSVSAFYDTEINVEIPNNSVEISKKTYLELLRGLSSGGEISIDATGKPFITEKIDNSITASQERAWRNSELLRADVELYKVQDADPKATGSVSAWREYKKALRNLPEHQLFPSIEARPVAPDVA